MDSNYDRIIKLAPEIAANARDKKFWDEPLTLAHCTGMLVSEIFELYSSGKYAEPSKKLPGFTRVAEEYADLIIRLVDTATHFNVRLIPGLFTNDIPDTREGALIYVLGKMGMMIERERAGNLEDSDDSNQVSYTFSFAISALVVQALREGCLIADAVKAKHRFNLTRPPLHGKNY